MYQHWAGFFFFLLLSCSYQMTHQPFAPHESISRRVGVAHWLVKTSAEISTRRSMNSKQIQLCETKKAHTGTTIDNITMCNNKKNTVTALRNWGLSSQYQKWGGRKCCAAYNYRCFIPRGPLLSSPQTFDWPQIITLIHIWTIWWTLQLHIVRPQRGSNNNDKGVNTLKVHQHCGYSM